MAGIGFELRKAIQQESVKGKISGYLGAAFSSSGSMLVAIILFFFIQFGAKIENVQQLVIDRFMCYVTNTMFLSMIVVSLFSLVLSRYVSNQIYEGKNEKVMPSLIGSTIIIAIIGGSCFAIMMGFSKLPLADSACLLLLFLVLSYCWLLMSYITLIREYKYVMIAYLTAFGVAIAVLVACCVLTQLNLIHMIMILTLCFAIVDVVLFRAVYYSFPKQDGNIFEFITEYKTSPTLSVVGFFMMLGMLGHFWATWFASPKSILVSGLFRYGPNYDFPAIVAFFSTIPASIYFITLFETDFSEKYQRYFFLLGNSGSVEEVNTARESMIESIRRGMKKLSFIQLLTCLLFITVGGKLLDVLNIGMTEYMLDSFRMFCVGYSLFFIANTLILIHLYFSNEKNIALLSSIFAIGSTTIAFISAKYTTNTDGLGFAIISAVLVVVATLKLVKHLSDLEYHVFSKQSVPIKKNITIKRTNTHNKKVLHYTVVAASLCFAIMLTSLSVIITDNIKASNIFEFVPTKSNAVLKSPGMGLAPWADSEETMDIDSTLVYVELKWSDWEPEEGIYNVDFVNDNFNLEYYKEDNRQVVFRFICDDPAGEEHIDIPEWLYRKIDGDGTMYSIDYGRGFSPNYSNPVFIEEHAEAIAALGEYFGDDDFFIYVELGSLGHWGEWHVNYEKGITRIPEYAIRQDYIRPYLDAFPNAMFLLRYPLIDAAQNGFGLYNDMTGDYDETLYWLEQMKGGVWEQTELPEQAVCIDTWKTHPIGGEFASTYDNHHFMVNDFDLTFESIIESHQSFIGPKIIIDESDTDYSKSMNKILKSIGYRLYVNKVSVDMNAKDSLQIICDIGNDGIAPIYCNYDIKLTLSDNDGNEVWASDDIEFDLTAILPNETKSLSCKIDRTNLDIGSKYNLSIAICDKSGKAVVPLALEKEVAELTYQIAEFQIK